MTTPTDEAVIDAETLFKRYAPFVARLLFRLGTSADALDDVVQEVFLVVHRNGGYVRGRATPTTYLASIAAKAAAGYRKKKRSAERWQSLAMVPPVLSSPSANPVQILEADETMAAISRALDALEPDLRTVFILADIEEQSCKAIAAALNIPVGTVYWRLHVARKRFERAVKNFSDPATAYTNAQARRC